TMMQHTAIFMPSVSPAITVGRIIRWHKRDGERVSAGDTLADIEMDNLLVQIEAVDDGDAIRIAYNAGSAASVNEMIGSVKSKSPPPFYRARILLRWREKQKGAEPRANLFYLSRPYYGRPGPDRKDPM